MAEASATTPALRGEAKTLMGHVQAVLADEQKREALKKQGQTYVTTYLSGFMKDYLSDSAKKDALMAHAHEIASAAFLTSKDTEKQASLTTMAKGAAQYAEQTIKDPVKRKELHDLVASTLQQLNKVVQTVNTTAAPAAAGAPATAKS